MAEYPDPDIQPGGAPLRAMADCDDCGAKKGQPHAADCPRVRAWQALGAARRAMSRADDPVDPQPLIDPAEALQRWWIGKASEEIGPVAMKAAAYGSNSLEQLGRKIAQLKGREVTTTEALELGCWINAVQKIERWTDAVMRGEQCADDTLHDAAIYIRMAQRVRAVGRWP